MIDKWIDIKDELPNKDTRHAGQYGVTVLYWDKGEAIDSGYFTPYITMFSFKHNTFLTQMKGLNDSKYGDWLPVGMITHWIPLPEPPKEQTWITNILAQ